MTYFIFDFFYSRIAAILIIFSLLYIVERLLPVEKGSDFSNIALNCACGFFYLAGGAFATFLVGSLFVRFSWNGLFSPFPDDQGSLIIAIGLSFVWLALRDFFIYWFHRLQHTSKWLWQEHRLHHTDAHLNVTTSLRHHWLEIPLFSIFVVAPLMFVFHPPLISVPIATAMNGLLDNFIHSNLKLNFGPFSRLLANPQYHRIHHSRLPEHRNRNFAVVCPMWDVIFGTYYHPRKDEYPPSGLSYGEPVTSLWPALIFPFSEWRRMLRKKSKP